MIACSVGAHAYALLFLCHTVPNKRHNDHVLI